MLKSLFNKRKKEYIELNNKNTTKVDFSKVNSFENIQDDKWVKCNKCGKLHYKDDLIENLKVCDNCNNHFRMGARERINSIIDKETFVEFDKELKSINKLDFPEYDKKLEKAFKTTKENSAVITGKGKIFGNEVIICVMDSRFMMGSMGYAVGEKIARAVEKATKERLPVIIFTASGGARMQEGIISLMQMAKTSFALSKHDEAGLLFISVLTDPTTGGVTASFAMLADIIVAEPDALIGFAGRRVIEKTINQKLPPNFQKSEFLLEHGFIDTVINRKNLKSQLSKILALHREGNYDA